MPIVSSTTNELQTSNNYTVREYNYNISYVDNFGGFVPYREETSDSDIRISYDYIPQQNTLSDSDIRIRYDLLDSVSLNAFQALRDLQKFWCNVNFKYMKKNKKFYNKI